jgi:phage terminase large subunit GpA-like protein
MKRREFLRFSASALVLRHEMGEVAQSAFRPTPTLSGSGWAETFYRIERVGRWRWESAPYMRGIQDSICNPNVPQVVLQKGNQIAGTMGGLVAGLGFAVHQRPTRVLVYFPTEDDAKKFSKDKLSSAFRETPVLRGAFGNSRNDDSLFEKRYAGGVIYIQSGRTPRTYRQTDAEWVFLDDLDAFELEVGPEGDPWSLAEGRTRSYRRGKRVGISTPTIKGLSRIESLYLACDRRRYHVACPHCRERQVLRWGDADAPYGFKWDWNEANGEKVPVFESVAYLCEACGALIDEKHKASMVRRAAEYDDRGWVAEFPERSRAGHSYHLPQFVSLFPGAGWQKILREWWGALPYPEQLKTVVQTVFAETWEERGAAPEWRRIYDRREEYPLATCPLGVEFITAGVDVQDNRLEAFVWGWGYDKESWFAEHAVFSGDPFDKKTWKPLTELLGKTWQAEAGGELPVAMLALDTGFAQEPAVGWALDVADPRVMLVKGDPWKNWSVVVGSPSRTSVTYRGKKTGLQLWPVGGALIKQETYGFLGLELPLDGEPYPPGFIHIPKIEQELCEQFVAEDLVTEPDARGYTVRAWKKKRHRNEMLDGRVYARAAAELMGLSRMRRPGAPPPRPPPSDPADTDADGGERREGGWLGRHGRGGRGGRRGGWLKRRS